MRKKVMAGKADSAMGDAKGVLLHVFAAVGIIAMLPVAFVALLIGTSLAVSAFCDLRDGVREKFRKKDGREEDT